MPKTILTSLRGSFLILLALGIFGGLSAQVNIELDGVNPICSGLASGSITSTVTGGSIPYTYNWSTGDEEPFIDNLTAGEYSLTVVDANGLGAVATITLTEPPLVTLDVSADQNCEAPFTLTANAGGGVGNFIYNWSTGESTPQIVVTDEIEYCVTVVDGNNCGTFECITPESNPPSVEVVSVDVLCFEDENGSLIATGDGGTPPYTFSWSNGDSGATINDLGPGTITVTLTDAAGCTATATGTVNEPPLLTTVTNSQHGVCPGEATGSATTIPSGGTPPYTYLWSTNAMTQGVAGLPAGTYGVTVTDANGCTVEDDVVIEELDGPEVTIVGGPVICGVGNTIDITATATGGTGNYQFEWSTNEFTQTITVGPGTYSVTVEDGNGCTDTETITIEVIDVDVTLSSTDVLCNGDENGTATATVTGGDEPYQYDWSNGETTPTITGLEPGTYTVIVTEANGCKATGSVTIGEPPALNIFGQVTDPLCADDDNGSINVTVSGGTPPYTYDWSDLAGDDNDEDRDNLVEGTYTVEVTDANGCTASETYTVDEPNDLNLDLDETDVLCNGDETGSIDVTVAGGTPSYTYNWSDLAGNDNPADRNGLSAGTYTVVVTDANGCTATGSVTISEPTALSVSADVTNVDCNGDATGAINLTVTGGTPPYAFSWSNGAMTEDLNGLEAGSYTGTVTDANGCMISATVDVTEPPALALDLDETDILCNGDETGAINVTVTGGTAPYSYDWSDLPGDDNPADRSDLSAGTYTVVVTDDNGCTIMGSVTITEPPALSIDLDETDVLCNGDATGAIDVTATGGTAPYNYNWSDLAGTDNPADRNGLSAGTYTVEVTDANGCTATGSVTISEPPALSVSADVTNVDCNGDATGAINLTVTGGTPPYAFSWSNGAMTEDLNGLEAGSYTGTVTDANGCMISATVTVTEPPALALDLDETDILCNGDETGAINVTVTGGTAPYSYDWSDLPGDDNPADRSDLSAGTYTVVVTDDNGCTISGSVTITESSALSIDLDETDVLCNGDATGAIDVTATGGTAPYTYNWSDLAGIDNPADRNGLSAGTYTVEVTDANGCTATGSVTISEPPALSVSADVTNVDCNGEATGAINLTVTGGTPPYSFSWSNGAMTEDLNGLEAGSYTGTVTDANGCMISATITVTEPPALGVSADVTNVACNGDATGAINLTVTGGTPPYSFSWSNGAMTEDLTGLEAGNYTGTVTDANGCMISATVAVTEPIALTCMVEILQEPTMGDNGSVRVIPTGGTPPYSFEWSTTQTTQTIDGLAPGTYTATVTDDNGCTTICSATLDAFSGIGDFVWEDLDLDGLQDPNEPGIEGVTVNLKDENGVVIATTTTDENGFYSFTGLTPGTYSVQFVPPAGFDYTASDIGADDTIDSDIIMGMMGMTGEYTLGPNEFNMTVDAGLIQPPNGGIFDPCNCLNNATNDINGQFADTLIITAYSGLEWRIIDRANMFLDDPINDPPAIPQQIPLGTILTETPMGDGFSEYRIDFRLIDDVTYMVSVQAGEFVLNISNTCTYPDIFFDELPPEELCVFDPAFPLDANSTIPGEITYFIAGQEVTVVDPSTLPVGTYNLEVRLDPLDEDECEAVLVLEFDIVNDCPAKVGDFVFLDNDGDGIQDIGDGGIEGVKVIITSQDGSFMDMQFTDENGMYMFMVDPGTYKITFEQPAGLSPSPQDQGGNDAIDSDVDPDMLMTDFFTLGPDEVNLTIDAGFRSPCVDNIEDPGTIGFDQEVCGPGNVPNTLVELTPATGGVGVINYLWMSNTVDPGQDISFWHPIPNSNSPNFTPGPVQQTTFFTRCVRRDDCPYLESNIITVTVGDDAVAQIDGPALGCEGDEITFTSAASGPGADISWSVTGDGNIIGDSDNESLTVVWGSFGIHSVTLTVTENGCTSTSTITISVVNNPMVCGGNLQANGTVNSVPNRDVTIEWMLPDDGYAMIFAIERSVDGENFEAVAQVTDPAVVLGQVVLYEYNEIAPVAGLNYYRVVAYDAFGESMTSNIVEFQLAEDDGQMARIFPNPTMNGTVHIEMNDIDMPAEDMTIEFISATGKSIDSQKLQAGADFFDLQIDGKASGIYFVRITCGDKVETHRVLVNE